MERNHLPSTLEFRWSVSRGRDTYGYNIVRLYVNGQKTKFVTDGGGYDMEGAVLGQWIEAAFPYELKKLQGEYYGLTWLTPEKVKPFKSSKVYTDETPRACVDGACGKSCMERILEAIGYELVFVLDRKNQTVYTLRQKQTA